MKRDSGMQQLPKDIQRLLLFALNSRSTYAITQLNKHQYGLITLSICEKLIIQLRLEMAAYSNVHYYRIPDGSIHGPYITYTGETVMEINNYRRGAARGLQERWYSNGAQQWRWFFTGPSEGIMTGWHPNGQMSSHIVMDSVRRRKTTWSSDGRILSEQ